MALALEGQGYRCRVAATPEQALELASGHVRLALIDERLIRREPLGFVRRLRTQCPSLKVIVLTDGSSEWEALQDYEVLRKVFSHEELLTTVRRALQ